MKNIRFQLIYFKKFCIRSFLPLDIRKIPCDFDILKADFVNSSLHRLICIFERELFIEIILDYIHVNMKPNRDYIISNVI